MNILLIKNGYKYVAISNADYCQMRFTYKCHFSFPFRCILIGKTVTVLSTLFLGV